MGVLLRYAFFLAVVRPLVLVLLGLNVRHRERLPVTGPAILAANHNSHLDALVLMSLVPLRLLPKVRPVAAADYFLANRALAWFSQRVVGIIPIHRGRTNQAIDEKLAPILAALERGDIVIFFPEGSRGEPERLTEFKIGLGLLAERAPQAPVVPIFLHGLGKVLPRGEGILVPFFCDVFVGEPVSRTPTPAAFMDAYRQQMAALAAEGEFPEWA